MYTINPFSYHCTNGMTLVDGNETEVQGGIKVNCLWSDDWEFNNSNGTSCVCELKMGLVKNTSYEL